jgi:hypothetical protein
MINEKSSVDLWETFFKRYCKQGIGELALNYPESKTLNINYKELWNFSIDVGQKIIDEPDIVLADANKALHDFILPNDKLGSRECRIILLYLSVSSVLSTLEN